MEACAKSSLLGSFQASQFLWVSSPGLGQAAHGSHSSRKNGFLSSSSTSRVIIRIRAAAIPVAPSAGPDLSVTVNGLRMPNPFMIGSGPPGTNYKVMKRAFDEGWRGVITKMVSLDSSKVVNVTPRYAKLRGTGARDMLGWENIELINDCPFETMLEEMKRLKEEYPNRILIASIMEEYNRDTWTEIIEQVQEASVDALEIKNSCQFLTLNCF